jgi:hypothetical protein
MTADDLAEDANQMFRRLHSDVEPPSRDAVIALMNECNRVGWWGLALALAHAAISRGVDVDEPAPGKDRPR